MRQAGLLFRRLERDPELRLRLRAKLGYTPHEDGAALDDVAIKAGLERRLVEDEVK